ncbi:MAG: glycerol-3-phosphate acyltransferase [Anaerolineae bacterium]|nr:MAG: glycerol-3-phosphate acyltransferase [Anaerolineae bacterium]
MNWGAILFATIVGYLIGSIPVGFLVSKSYGVNILDFGSGRSGGTNVLRPRLGPFILTVCGDALKAAAAIALARYVLNAGELGAALAGGFAVVGHNWSIFLKFRGGAGGVTTGFGLLVLSFYAGAIVVPLAILAFYLSHYASVGTLTVALGSLIALTVLQIAFPGLAHLEHILFGLIVAVSCTWSLRPNIQRLLNGTERRVTHW